MKQRIVLVLVIVVGFFFTSPRPAQASGTVGSGTAASCTEAALATALTGGGNVNFNCGTAPATITLTGVYTINANTTVDGGKQGQITLKGTTGSQIFYVNDGQQLTLKNMVLREATGYAILGTASSTITIINSTIRNNGTGAVRGDGVLNIQNSDFSYNGQDGAVALGQLTITGLTASNNGRAGVQISYGGIPIVIDQLYADKNGVYGVQINGTGASTTIKNSVISNNQQPASSGQSGAGIYATTTADLYVTNTTFLNNKADVYAGAIYKYSSGILSITDSTFTNNISGSSGGAIFAGAGTALTITGSTFTGNAAPTVNTSGGAISLLNPGSATISNSVFKNNQASYQGGAIYDQGNTSQPVTIQNSTFFNNRSLTDVGGAIFASGSVPFNVTGNTFQNNQAATIGGAVTSTTDIGVTNNTFVGNTASDGSAFAVIASFASPIATLINNTITGNTASRGTGDGGAVDRHDSIFGSATLILKNNIVSNNPGGNCSTYSGAGPITDGGNNIQYPGTVCGATITTSDPLLNTPLADHGGATQTIDLQSGSPALNAGNNTVCNASPVNNVDQRGLTRIYTGNPNCDIGAYENPTTYTACTLAELDAAIAAGGDHYFNCASPTTITVPATRTFTLSTQIRSNGNLTLKTTSNITLLQVSSTAAFVSLRNLTLNIENAAGTDVALGIASTGTVDVTGVSFVKTGGSFFNGFGIQQQSGTLKVYQSSFGLGPGTGLRATGGTTIITQSTFGSYSRSVDVQTSASVTINDSTITTPNSSAIGVLQNSTQPVTINRSNLSGAGPLVSETGAFVIMIQSSTLNPSNYGVIISGGTGLIYNSTIVSLVSISPTLSISGGGTGTRVINSTIVGTNTVVQGSDPFFAKNSVFYALGTSTTCQTNSVIDLGNNVQYPGTACSSTIPSVDPKLGALQNNGGTMLTMRPFAFSPLIDAGSNDTCSAGPINNLDQRSIPRPLDGDGNTTLICDIGAVEAPTVPTIAKSFNPPLASTIVVGGTATLKFTLQNLNSDTNFTNVAFTDLLASNVIIANPASVTNTCPTPGTVDADPGSGTVTVVGAGIPINSTCTITVNVTSSKAGLYNNIASAISSLETGTASTSNTVTLTVLNYLTITHSFATPITGVNNPVTLTYTLVNPNAVTALTGVGFANTLPSNVQIAPTPNITSSCFPAGNIPEGAGATTVTLSGAGIPANSSCTVSVNVIATITGTYNNTTGTITSLETGAGSPSNTTTLLAINRPVIIVSAAPGTIDAGSESTLTYTLANPNAGVALSNLSFTHVLPSGVTFSTTPLLSTTCPDKGTVTPVGFTTINVAGFGLGKGGTCSISINILGGSSGGYSLAPATATTTETGSGATITPASLTVNATPSIVNLSLSSVTIGTGATTSLSFAVKNTTGSPLTNVSVNTTLPSGLLVADGIFNNTCPTIGTMNAPVRGNSIAIAGVGLPASATCTITLNIFGATVGDYSFTTGAVSSTQTGVGAVSNKIGLLVLDYPVLSASFNSLTTGLNQTVALTFTLNNPNRARSLSAVAFSQNLPANLNVAGTPNVINSCSTPGTVIAPGGGSSISLASGGLNPAEFCTITLNVTNIATGMYSTSTNPISSAETGTGAASNPVQLTVLSYPTISIGFAPIVFKSGTITTITYTLNNPNSSTLSKVEFKHELPTGLQIASIPSVFNTCATPGTVIAPPGGTTISLTGLGMNASQTCIVAVNITSSVPGIYVTQTSAIQSKETGVGAGSNAAQVKVAHYTCDSTGVDTAITNGGPATFACVASTTVSLTAIKTITTDTALDGAGLLKLQPAIPIPPPLHISPNARDGRIYGAIQVNAGVTLRISGVTIMNNNNATTSGLMIKGNAIISNVTFQSNSISGALMIKDGAQVTVLNSTFVNNSSTTDGAAIYVETSPASSLTVVNSTFSGNGVTGSGGAVYVETGSTATFINSTFNGNSASVSGGAIYYQGTVTLTNTIIANSSSGGNCAGTGTLVNGGSNLQYPGTTCGTAITTADPLLSALAANGGRTQTMAIASTSPAIGNGNYAVCSTPLVRAVDQRGYLRQASSVCDIGAFEYGATPPTLSVTMPTQVTAGVPFDVTVTAIDLTNNTVTGYTGAVHFTSTDGAAILPADYTFNDLGLGAHTFSVILNTLGNRSVTVTDTANNTPTVTGSATTTVLMPPTVALGFAPSSIQAGRVSTLRFTLTNPNAAAQLNHIALTLSLPPQIAVAANPRPSATCATKSITATPGSNSIVLGGISIVANQSCVISVDVTSNTAGIWLVQVGQGTALETNPGAKSNVAVLTVGSAGPTVSAAFAPASIFVNNSSALVFSLLNSSPDTFTGIQFNATLPTQINVSSPVLVTNTCSTAGSVTTTSGIQVSGLGMTPGERCTISISVTSLSVGSWNVQTSAVANTQTGTGAASNVATLVVAVAKLDTIGIYRPSNNTFYLKLSNSTGFADLSVQFGSSPNHYPIVGDWNGDNVDTVGYYDRSSGFFYLRDSNTPGAADHTALLGNPSDYPIAGRWTPDMTHDGIGVLRPSNGILYMKKDLTTGFSDFFAVLGNPGDVGVAGDWDGNGYDSPGIFRPSEAHFYLTNNSTPFGITFSDLDLLLGSANLDAPVVGDWIGQGHAGAGVFRVSNGVIYLRNTLTTGFSNLSFVFGGANDIPVAGHWVAGPIPPPAIIVRGGTTPITVNPDNGGAD